VLFFADVRAIRAALSILSVVFIFSCSNSGGPSPLPTPTPGSPVQGLVFYDENANGLLDASETVRLQNATVRIGASSATSVAGGRFVVPDVQPGSQPVQVTGLPPYYTPGAGVAASVPQAPGTDLNVPVTLSLQGNRANLYVAFGDSITAGDGSNDGSGYLTYLETDLRNYLGKATVVNEGISGTRSYGRSNAGQERLGSVLGRRQPAYVLILYGTNDWNIGECRSAPPCGTIDALRDMAQRVLDYGSHPVLGTIPPVNPGYVDQDAAARNDWVRFMNDRLKQMAAQLRVPVADIHAAFVARPNYGTAIMADFLHPNEQGHVLIAQTWFQAITRPAAAAAARPDPFSMLAPGARLD
jgi:acyl-CoA thioesterase-1